jgi:MFS family permease
MKPSHNPPWLFSFLAMPAGISFWCVSALLIPYLLRKHGVAVNHIAEASALASIPTFCFFLWSPVVDLGMRRRTWILLSSGVTGACGALAVGLTSGSFFWLTVAWVASNVANSLPSATVGAVMATLPAEVRGRASGWYQIGNVAIGSLAGGACIWLADRVPAAALSLIVGALIFLPALAGVLIHEVPLPHAGGIALFRELARDLRDLAFSWRTVVGVAFFCSPVGSGALGNLISSVGPDYHVSNAEVAFVSGLGGSLLMGIGGLAGGFVCDRLHRMTAYALFGLLAAVFAAWLALGQATPFTYGAGYSGYAFSTGLAYTAYNAVVLDVLGHNRRAAASGYSLLSSFGNLPVAYMTWLEGVGYKHAGVRGLMSVDALGNGLVGLLLLLVARYCARKWRTEPREETVAAAVPA